MQKLYYSAGENVDGALTQKATSEAIEAAQYLPIVNHPNAPVGDTALSVELQQNVMNVIGGVGYAFTTITMTLATKKAGRVNRYFGRFTTGGNAIAVTWPTGVTVPSALSYKTQTTYDFVIEDSILHVWEDGNAVGDVLDATATANAVSTWLTNHPEATTTVADGSITTAKLASGVIDQTLTVQGAAADSAKVGQEISDLKSQIAQFEAIPWAVKQAMDTLFQNVAFKNDDIYTDELATFHAWASAINVTSISAVYTQSGTIYDDDTLDDLKSDLVVTASYDNGTSATISGYTLSGTLEIGTSTITVTYEGKTATFTVTVSDSRRVPTEYTWLYDPRQGELLSEQSYVTKSGTGTETINGNGELVLHCDNNGGTAASNVLFSFPLTDTTTTNGILSARARLIDLAILDSATPIGQRLQLSNGSSGCSVYLGKKASGSNIRVQYYEGSTAKTIDTDFAIDELHVFEVKLQNGTQSFSIDGTEIFSTTTLSSSYTANNVIRLQATSTARTPDGLTTAFDWIAYYEQ